MTEFLEYAQDIGKEPDSDIAEAFEYTEKVSIHQAPSAMFSFLVFLTDLLLFPFPFRHHQLNACRSFPLIPNP